MNRSFPISIAVFFLALSASPTHGQTIILVRHAEKAPGTGDVALSEAGAKRADKLAAALKDAGVTAIYCTNTKRTQQTAEPLANALKLTSVVRPATESATATVNHLTQSHTTGCVLVVGHSNTVPSMISELLKRDSEIQIGENEFDRLLILTKKPDGTWGLLRARY